MRLPWLHSQSLARSPFEAGKASKAVLQRAGTREAGPVLDLFGVNAEPSVQPPAKRIDAAAIGETASSDKAKMGETGAAP